ncbi:MAG: hypothetical protein UW46_C0010G0015 [Candidatus Yanofskybacteria bacterium GW2011_GWF1_44_227]|uniref:Uncharacterized protein n=1 Tax=Candidatus Yanofskybacteria bacterium GW2011_GWE2_40_11 TaxID=1619033 RepID=A0A0G0QIC2_9BACT|nr:MAG: hypothetical protein UT69_C0001G0028 [Candidatus Yanofskybacteria bacterium GW2011_GWE1_40_10]KKR40089.1 MAG: hypothetical protein UT75_C0010G0028 [Candidatus Yanofskybacteria bacterium GW2011_GWE2_40_11]KKT14760.1 MAG: hypothetical protein UV97_C0016G0006 [Candidatus Yanofskybacteria bacterium GW2011_GWF2_43_596]KKT52847.1 MAG: hypothetical protein UW46_C0010G0015 [Candidatus Yanofskybacteria bacterium GW2011_GWF1_44_227]OGN35639.1 MAG: hypothetical protein A2207_03630 [Candidatus Yano
MKIDELKKLMNKSTAVLVMENGDPSYVVLNYDTYKDLVLTKEDEKSVKINQNLPPQESLKEPVFRGVDEIIAASKMTFGENELEILERINKDIQVLREEIQKEEKLLTID